MICLALMRLHFIIKSISIFGILFVTNKKESSELAVTSLTTKTIELGLYNTHIHTRDVSIKVGEVASQRE